MSEGHLHDLLLAAGSFLAGMFVSKLVRDVAARKAPPPGSGSLAPKEDYVPPPPAEQPGKPEEGYELNIRSRSGFYKRR